MPISIPVKNTHRKAFHGGKSFQAIGECFEDLDRAASVITADVLDAWFDPSPRVIGKLRAFLPMLMRSSPPIYAAGLVNAISRARGIPEDCILTGGGSSDLIFACIPQLLRSNQTALILDPMYSEYRHLLETVIEADVRTFDLLEENDFRIETDALIRAVRTQCPALVALVNPNSPTGQLWPRREVVRFLNAIPEQVKVFIDETYVEYAGPGQSVEDEACSRKNVFVLKSMSKMYALSGLRVGYMVSSSANIDRLAPTLPPWAVSLPGQVAAVEALSDSEYYKDRYLETAVLREGLAASLRIHSSLKVYPSITNLLLLRTNTSAARICERLREENIFIRNCDSMGLRFGDRFLRIAVKNRTDNERVAHALLDCLEGRGSPSVPGHLLRD